MHYAGPDETEGHRVNINTADYDELMKLPGMNETFSRRIILYREKIGPVTRDSLVQIGMTGDEIRKLNAAVCGFERRGSPDDKDQNKAKIKKRKPAGSELVKSRFKELLSAGIPAYQAARYSGLSADAYSAGFDGELSADSTLSAEQKRTIKRICGK
jgi:hypothetical protein